MNDAYPLPPFQIHSDDTLYQIIRRYPLATLISGEAGNACISLIPMILEDEPGSATLIGHLDNNNPQARLLAPNSRVSFQFQGPNSYASPDLYPDSQLPGWLYVSVQGDGHIQGLLSEDELAELLIKSTSLFGATDQRFSLSLQDSRIDKFASLITGFRLRIDSLRGIAKLAQDKGSHDAAIAKNYLAEQCNSESIELFERILTETL